MPSFRLWCLLVSLLVCSLAHAKLQQRYRFEYALYKQWSGHHDARHDVRLSQYLPAPEVELHPPLESLSIQALLPIMERVEAKHPGCLIQAGAYVLELMADPMRVPLYLLGEETQQPLGWVSLRLKHFIDSQWSLRGISDDVPFYLSQKRRTRLSTVNYLDHPDVGLVFGVWPMESSDSDA